MAELSRNINVVKLTRRDVVRLELIGNNLKRARQTLRLSQTTVGSELGLPRQAISAIEAGKREITITQLLKFTNLYRLKVEW